MKVKVIEQGWLLLGALGESPFLCISQTLPSRSPTSGFSCHFLFCSQISLCLSFIKTLVILYIFSIPKENLGLSPHLKIPNLITSAKSLLPCKVIHGKKKHRFQGLWPGYFREPLFNLSRRSNQSVLKGIKPVNLKGNQAWKFTESVGGGCHFLGSVSSQKNLKRQTSVTVLGLTSVTAPCYSSVLFRK